VTITPGDVVISRPAGGGGYGDPLRRDPAAVAWAVRSDYVARDAAATLYGVVLAEAGEVGADATAQARAEPSAGA
jgi:N-methylhydantoinase B